jgi:hypothetical protein
LRSPSGSPATNQGAALVVGERNVFPKEFAERTPHAGVSLTHRPRG